MSKKKYYLYFYYFYFALAICVVPNNRIFSMEKDSKSRFFNETDSLAPSNFFYEQAESISHYFKLHDLMDKPEGQSLAKFISCSKIQAILNEIKNKENYDIGCMEDSSAFHALFNCYWIIKIVSLEESNSNNRYDFKNIAELFWSKELNKNLREKDSDGNWRKIVKDIRKNERLINLFDALPQKVSSQSKSKEDKIKFASKALEFMKDSLEEKEFEDDYDGLNLSGSEISELIDIDNQMFDKSLKSKITIIDLQEEYGAGKGSDKIVKVLTEFSREKNKIHAFIINDDNQECWYSVILNKKDDRIQCIAVDSSNNFKKRRETLSNILIDLHQYSIADLLKSEVPRNRFSKKSQNNLEYKKYSNSLKFEETDLESNQKHETVMADIQPSATLKKEDFIGNLPKGILGVINGLNNPKFRSKREKNTLLLYGPSGNGKTTIARIIAGETNRIFLSVNGSDLITSYQASGPKSVKKLFDTAKSFGQKCIVFIDEIDGIAQRRNPDLSDERQAGLRKLLTLIDEYSHDESIFIIGATNTQSALDEAIVSRFQDAEISLPKSQERFTLLKSFLDEFDNYEKKFSDDELRYLTTDGRIWSCVTGGLSVRDLESVAQKATLNAREENRFTITKFDLEEAIKSIQDKTYKNQETKRHKLWLENEQRFFIYF